MSNTIIAPVYSVPAVNFLNALAAASSTGVPPFATTPINNLYGLPPSNSRRYLVRAIIVVTLENFGPEISFWSKAQAPSTTDPTGDSFLGRWGFIGAQGEQQGGAGLFRYYIDGLAIPYYDLDWINAANSGGANAGVNPPTLHVSMANIDTTAKSAGAPGLTALTVQLEPMQAY